MFALGLRKSSEGAESGSPVPLRERPNGGGGGGGRAAGQKLCVRGEKEKRVSGGCSREKERKNGGAEPQHSQTNEILPGPSSGGGGGWGRGGPWVLVDFGGSSEGQLGSGGGGKHPK